MTSDRDNPILGEREWNLGPGIIACITVVVLMVGALALAYGGVRLLLWLATQ